MIILKYFYGEIEQKWAKISDNSGSMRGNNSEDLYCDINCVVYISVYLECFEHIRFDLWNIF